MSDLPLWREIAGIVLCLIVLAVITTVCVRGAIREVRR